ncbi:PREDICTED: uncharacterized protein LOC106338298 [Brassica oleracea var. oleracea]|uniref:uncharacterized protein LOC106338298 n=1 Tax=Brassica oleracea var. oleracea TaxID=109376 RepID=UPI0006A6CF9B|nr:PREDICTED: uncharacterized protein LOC106338298 [Brassica oleracea var. oleracea]
MVDKEMVVGMPQVIHEKDVCNACLVGKQTRKSFLPKAKYRASHALELVHGTLLNVIKQFKDDMSRRFEMSNLGKLTYYLGIEVTQGADGIHIKQEGYAQVALSSCEAEFMAATEAAKQAIWLKELMVEIMNKEDKKVVLKIDNKSAIALTKNPVFHGRSKHILSKYPFIRECVEFDFIEVKHVPGVEQKADILTKPLAMIKFEAMRKFIGVKKINIPKIQIWDLSFLKMPLGHLVLKTLLDNLGSYCLGIVARRA